MAGGSFSDSRQPLRLAFSGLSGAGKDTVGRAALDEAGHAPLRLSFGDLVKGEVTELLRCAEAAHEWPPASAERFIADKLRIEPHTAQAALQRLNDVSALGSVPNAPIARALYQWWGTDVRRTQNPRYWLRGMEAKLTQLGPQVSAYVADCRFEDELALCRRYGFTTVRLRVDDHTRRARLLTRDGYASSQASVHATETSVTDNTPHDVFVTNTGPLQQVVDKLFSALLNLHQ
ncbi:hypothetical protein [Streptomyces monashensis]|uniref:hypothetical protein n=1 Tax=Streptomyces monashensis TaxID=1678012 RepID=UPI000AFFDFBD|nr:hypothetical protein [Streptomyces monashensis]